MKENFFGSDTYFIWLKTGLTAGDPAVMETLLLDVNRYARSVIRDQVPRDEVEDVLMAVDCGLLTHIAAFLRNSETFSPYQRQRWLKTLIRTTMLDYLAENAPADSWRDRKRQAAREENVPETQVLSWECYTEERDIPSTVSLEESVIGATSSQVLEDLIRTLCTLRVEPAALLAFLYHNVVFFLETDARKKGHPEETAERLQGKTLGMLRDALPAALRNASGYTVPKEVFSLLDQKLQGHRQEVFQYDSRKISASVSYLKKRMNEKQGKSI